MIVVDVGLVICGEGKEGGFGEGVVLCFYSH